MSSVSGNRPCFLAASLVLGSFLVVDAPAVVGHIPPLATAQPPEVLHTQAHGLYKLQVLKTPAGWLLLGWSTGPEPVAYFRPHFRGWVASR